MKNSNQIEQKLDLIIKYLEQLPEVKKYITEKEEMERMKERLGEIIEVEFIVDPRTYYYEDHSKDLRYVCQIFCGFKINEPTIIKDTRENILELKDNVIKYISEHGCIISDKYIMDFYSGIKFVELIHKNTEVKLSDYCEKRKY